VLYHNIILYKVVGNYINHLQSDSQVIQTGRPSCHPTDCVKALNEMLILSCNVKQLSTNIL